MLLTKNSHHDAIARSRVQTRTQNLKPKPFRVGNKLNQSSELHVVLYKLVRRNTAGYISAAKYHHVNNFLMLSLISMIVA